MPPAADRSADPRPSMPSVGRGRTRCPAMPSASRREDRWRRCVGRRCGCAPRSASVRDLNSITSGWSTSYTVVPSGHGNRYALASNPAARMTACRTPAAAASVNSLSKWRVRTAIPSAARSQAEPGIHVLEVDLAVERPNEEVEADRAHQRLGERIVDQPLAIGQHALRGDHGGGCSDAGCQVPGVVVGPGHHAPCRVAVEISGIADEPRRVRRRAARNRWRSNVLRGRADRRPASRARQVLAGVIALARSRTARTG